MMWLKVSKLLNRPDVNNWAHWEAERFLWSATAAATAAAAVVPAGLCGSSGAEYTTSCSLEIILDLKIFSYFKNQNHFSFF